MSKVSLLVGARLMTQLVGVAWFLVLARVFEPVEMAVLAAGLVTFAVVSVIGDAGTSWSLAREVTADPTHAWWFYRDAVRLRMRATGLVGAVTLAAAAAFVDGDMWRAMAIGVAVSVASGLSETAMSTLRAVGSVRFEAVALPSERLGFVAIAGAAVALGGGPIAVMSVYLLTNVLTAGAAARLVVRDHRRSANAPVGRLWGRETRGSGLAFAVVALGPRVNVLVVVLMLSSVEVADYSVASRPIEQLSLAAIGFSSSMLPLLRDDVVKGRDMWARSGSLAAGFVTIGLAGVVWVSLSAESIIDTMYGTGRYPTASGALALLAPITLTWPLRGLAGMVMVASSRAVVLARVSATGLVANLALIWPLVAWFGIRGAATALLTTDLVTVVVLVAVSGMRLSPSLRSRLVVGAVVSLVVGMSAAMLPFAVAAGLIAVTATAMAVSWAFAARADVIVEPMGVS